jgi:hypothetical protein
LLRLPWLCANTSNGALAERLIFVGLRLRKGGGRERERAGGSCHDRKARDSSEFSFHNVCPVFRFSPDTPATYDRIASEGWT